MATLSSPTAQNLISDVRMVLKQRDPNNSFWTDNEILGYLNEGVRQYFLECTVGNEGYFTTQTDLDIAQNVETVALPTDCFEVKNLWKKVTNGFLLLPYRNSLTEGYYTQGGSASQSYLPYYYFQNNNLVLRPTPNFSETAGLRIEYIQFPDNMVWGGDSLTNQVSPVFKELIEGYAVYKCKWSESLTNGAQMHVAAEQNLAQLYQRFKDTISRRSKNPTFMIPFSPETENY